MEDNKFQFTTFATFSDFKPALNPSFHKARLRIMALDSVAFNGAKFSRKGTIKALPTLKNVPLVTQYDTKTGNLKSHEFESDGNALTYGIGTIAESCEQWIEEVEENGKIVEYLCSEVLLWKRQKREYEFIKRHKNLNVSMEVMMLSPKKGKDGALNVDNFYFTAVTVLGVGVNPAFGEANLVFSKDSSDYQQMMFELNEFENGGSSMTVNNPTVPVVEGGEAPVNTEPTQVDNTQTQTTEGGENHTPATEGEGVNPENPENPDNTVGGQPNAQGNEDPDNEPDSEPDTVDYKAKFEELEAELSRTIIDLTKERDNLTTQLEEAQNQAQTQITSLQKELDELKQFKTQIERDKLSQERKAILDQFTDLEESDDYKELMEQIDNLTPKVLEDKLYIIAGRIARQNRKSQKQQVKPKVSITTLQTEEQPTPDFQFAKFLMK